MSKMSPEEEEAVQAELAELQREALVCPVRPSDEGYIDSNLVQPAIPSVPEEQPVSLPSVPVEEPVVEEPPQGEGLAHSSYRGLLTPLSQKLRRRSEGE